MVTRLTAWLLGLALILLVFLSYSMLYRPARGASTSKGVSGTATAALEPGEKLKMEHGVVLGFKPNSQLDIDALLLKTADAGELTIGFKPHTAAALMRVTAPGDSVEVGYSLQLEEVGNSYRLRLVRNQRTGKEVAPDKLPAPSAVPPDRSAEYFLVRQPSFVLDEFGGVAGLWSGSKMFQLKPGLVYGILPLLKNAQQLGLSAVWRDDRFGFVNAVHDSVYIVLSITMDNKTFLVR